MDREAERLWRWAPVLALAALILAGLACGAGAKATQAPGTPPDTTALITPTALLATQAVAQATPQAAIPEERLLVLEWPAKMRLGDAEIIRLSLEMNAQGQLTPTVLAGGNGIEVEPVQIPNLYATHHVVAEARLDLAGVEYTPSGDVSEALSPGRPVTFIWSVRPEEIGVYRGTVWLHLRFAPLDGGPESRSVLSAQLIEIEVVNFLGLGGTAARIFGSVGVVVGSVLGLDNVLSWLWKLVSQRKRRHVGTEME
jgi:hypothetical protein